MLRRTFLKLLVLAPIAPAAAAKSVAEPIKTIGYVPGAVNSVAAVPTGTIATGGGLYQVLVATRNLKPLQWVVFNNQGEIVPAESQDKAIGYIVVATQEDNRALVRIVG